MCAVGMKQEEIRVRESAVEAVRTGLEFDLGLIDRGDSETKDLALPEKSVVHREQWGSRVAYVSVYNALGLLSWMLQKKGE